MLEELIKNKIYYKIFDKSCTEPTHTELTHNYNIGAFSEEVKNNIDIVVKKFSADKILLLNQTHGNNIICPDDFEPEYGFPEGDASISTKKNMVLAIRTADCVPVLLASEDGSVIGAAHCGWRSSKLDIIAKLAKSMRQKGASNIVAIIGPSIAQQSYEVSGDYYHDFVTESAEYKELFLPSIKDGHYMFDLPAFVRLKLAKAGIKITKHIAEDTYSKADKYPSYRRYTHTGEGYSHEILSAIIMK